MMKRAIGIVGLALFSSASLAAAQPAAPSSESTDDLSHINGQLVPVGQHNEYHYRFRRTNIATNPISMLFGFYGASIAHAVTANLVVRGDVTLMAPEQSEPRMFDVTATAVLYPRRAYSGPFIEGGAVARSTSCKDTNYCANDKQMGLTALVGYHWTYDSGFNIALAAGATRFSDSTQNSELEPAGYLRVGYAF